MYVERCVWCSVLCSVVSSVVLRRSAFCLLRSLLSVFRLLLSVVGASLVETKQM